MLVDGSMQYIERDMAVKWEVELEHVDPEELERMGEAAVRNLVEKSGRGWKKINKIPPFYTVFSYGFQLCSSRSQAEARLLRVRDRPPF